MESLDSAALRDEFARDARRNGAAYGAYTAAEVLVARETLGLTRAALGDALGVTERAVARWEDGQRAISDECATGLDALMERAEREVQAVVRAMQDAPQRDRRLLVYRSDAHLAASGGEPGRTAGWTRAIARRVQDRFDGQVDIDFMP